MMVVIKIMQWKRKQLEWFVNDVYFVFDFIEDGDDFEFLFMFVFEFVCNENGKDSFLKMVDFFFFD